MLRLVNHPSSESVFELQARTVCLIEECGATKHQITNCAPLPGSCQPLSPWTRPSTRSTRTSSILPLFRKLFSPFSLHSRNFGTIRADFDWPPRKSCTLRRGFAHFLALDPNSASLFAVFLSAAVIMEPDRTRTNPALSLRPDASSMHCAAAEPG